MRPMPNSDPLARRVNVIRPGRLSLDERPPCANVVGATDPDGEYAARGRGRDSPYPEGSKRNHKSPNAGPMPTLFRAWVGSFEASTLRQGSDRDFCT